MENMENVLSISGGKDSTAMLLLAIERETPNLSAVFADTGNEHDLTYEHVRMLERETGVPVRWVKADFGRRMAKKAETVDTKWRAEGIPDAVCDRAIEILHNPTGIPYLDLCILKSRFPASQSQFCTGELKIYPINEQVTWPLLDAGTDVYSWQGIRKSESRRRALQTETEHGDTFDSGATLTFYRPLLEWSADDVFAMHRKHGIDPNPLYLMGMERVGCMPCINCRKDELLEISKRFPEHVDRIREWEQIVGMASKRGKATFFTMTVPGDRGSIDDEIRWSKTKRGGKQFDILRGIESEGCMSSYGLCE